MKIEEVHKKAIESTRQLVQIYQKYVRDGEKEIEREEDECFKKYIARTVDEYKEKLSTQLYILRKLTNAD